MSISAVETKMPNAISVEVSGKALSVKLSDGRMVAIPVDQYPRLAYATRQERANWRIIGRGHGIHWEDIDEDISVEGLLAGNRSGESTTSLMRWLLARHQPKFRPWKGEGYGEANDLGLPENLLILGESHYNDLTGEDREDWRGYWDGQPTQGVVAEYCRKRNRPLFTKIFHTILGPDTDPSTQQSRSDFFNSVAFCNYVQECVGDAHHRRPSQQMWEEAAAPFRATLECLRPTHIVACGMRLWRNMPYNDDFWTPPSETLIDWLDSVELPTLRRPKRILGCYRHSQGQSAVLAIHHPSWKRYQPSRWHPVVERFLEYSAG